MAGWPLAIGTFVSVSAFGLFVFGAMASEPMLSHSQRHYSLSVPVPTPITKQNRHAPNGDTKKNRVPAASAAVTADAASSGLLFDAADEAYVIKAMRTGEFQEWAGPDGQRRFLNAGPEQAQDDKRCRDLALLIRHPDGSSQARSARRCEANRNNNGVSRPMSANQGMTHAAVVSDMLSAPRSAVMSSPMDLEATQPVDYGDRLAVGQ